METSERKKRKRAQQRIKEIKAFYIHLTVYVLVNLFIITATVWGGVHDFQSFLDRLFDFSIWVTPFFWGIGLAGHASKVFGYNLIFNKDWEERQIQKYMEEDKRESEKYKELGNGYGGGGE